jgi:hypothetical protein
MTLAGKTGAMQQARTRLELARGHWSLGERDEAVVCLERLAALDAAAEGLLALVEDLQTDCGTDGDSPAQRLAALARRLRPDDPIAPPAGSPLVTGTLASLLVEQGHAQQALAVAEDVLRARPDDARALAVRERVRGGQAQRVLERLERWLSNIDRLKRRGAQA